MVCLEGSELVGTSVDWPAFTKAIADRWEDLPSGATHCKLHGTFFHPNRDDGEPCWECLFEFEKEK